MEFTEEQLDQFIALYKQQYGEELSRVEAHRQFLSLLRLMALSVPPLEIQPDISQEVSQD